MLYPNRYFAENESKGKKIKHDDSGEEEVEEEDTDSQFFKVASKALKKLHMRKSTSLPNNSKLENNPGKSTVPIVNAQHQQKVFKSPKAKLPLTALVSSIFTFSDRNL